MIPDPDAAIPDPQNMQTAQWKSTLTELKCKPMKQIIEELIAKHSKFAKNGYNFLDDRSTTFGIFLQTYLRFSEVVFFTCYHQQIEKRDC